MESKAKPASDAGSAVSKPLSFLERARLARGKQPDAAEQNPMKNSMEELDTIQRENEEAMNYRSSTRAHETEKRINEHANSVPESRQSGYQPTTSIAPQNPTLLGKGSNTNLGSNSNLPTQKRRRAGDSPRDEVRTSQMSSERPRQFNDPFANVRPSASIASGAPTPLAGGAYTPSQPMTYEQKMKNEASKGSFLDMIGGGGGS